MYLKELTLRGFKSFASATTLRFEPGITAVVGPNGSGKSNIVDALTWVMGEQGAKNLRGTAMEDVIFAGTSDRPPLGRAQVSLTIDNTDRALDIDYTEVTISRTIFRGGACEYAINGSSCRLLDIQELLSDTGLGQQMHVIVGQGRLDAILKADPAGHRAFIEEAAGILKHRKRKERALRKLKHAEDNVARTDDLLQEIHRQLGPLGRQAKISRRADGIQVTLRDAQARLLADDAQEVVEQREQARNRMGMVRGELEEAQRSLATIKERIEQAEALSSRSSPAIAQANEIWHDYSQLEERFEALSALAAERARHAREQVSTGFGEDPDVLEARACELDEQTRQAAQTADDARLAFDQATEQRAGTEKRLAAARQTLNELRRVSQQRESQKSGLRSLLAQEEAATQLAQTRLADVDLQREGLRQQRDDMRARIAGLEQDRPADDEHDADQLDQARDALRERTERFEELSRHKRDLDSNVVALKAKAEALDDTLESRNAAEELKADDDVTVLGSLTEFIHVSDGWEEAVAQALGQFANALVVPDEQGAGAALLRAKNEHLGRAVALYPLTGDGRSGEGNAAGSGDASGDTGGETGAGAMTSNTVHEPRADSMASLVSANAEAHNPSQAAYVVESVRLLLEGIAAVETLDDGFAAVKRGCRQAVTRDGEIVNPVGAVGGSALRQSDLSLAAKRDKALAEAALVAEQAAEVQQQVEQAQRDRDEAGREVDKQATARAEARSRAKQAEQSLHEAHAGLQRLDGQIRALDERENRLHDDLEEHQLKLDDTKTALERVDESAADGTDFNDVENRTGLLERELDKSREVETSAKIAWNDANRKAESLQRQAGLLHTQASDAAQRRERMQRINEQRQREASHATAIAGDAQAVARLVRERLEAVGQYRVYLQRQASGTDNELKALREQRSQAEPAVAQLQRQEHDLDVERERLAARYGQLEQQSSDELGLGLEELVREYGPNLPVPVLDENGRPVPVAGAEALPPTSEMMETELEKQRGTDGESDAVVPYQSVPYVRQEQEKRVLKAQRDLKALGKVNPLATEEFEALEARNQYLNEQRNDVAKSRDDLLQLIKDLDATMVEVFRQAFDDTATAFEQVFATLFPGGTGRLRLEDPDDMLTTGVIVEASPAGKRVKQLSLLSGGERSLTALALLFAIFTARPSPFYVMDEVEAALDDLNLTRLLNALNDLREHAQLIIITHQQRTMSIADALYGITMRADGVSAVISQKLDRQADAER